MRVLLVVLIALFASFSHAQPTAPTKDQQREAAAHFRKGFRMFQEGDYRSALVEFKRAYELAPSFNVFYNLGQVYLKLQDYPAALVSLERYLAEGKDNIAKSRSDEVKKDIEKLRMRVAHVTVEVEGGRGADVAIDDVVVGKAPGTFTVGPGRHKIAVGQTVRLIEIASGEKQTLRMPAPK